MMWQLQKDPPLKIDVSCVGEMKISQNCTEKLRPLVGNKSWDYCVIWKLSDDQRRVEWMGCCCGGAEMSREEEDHRLATTPLLICRDVMFQHPRTKACEALDELPASMPLYSGNHTEALVTNKPVWLNLPGISSSNFTDVETVKTKVLIPVTCGLIELFAAKHVPEDHQIVEFVMAQCNSPSWDPGFHDQTLGTSVLNDAFLSESTIDPHTSKPFSCNDYSLKNTTHFQPWIQPATDNLNFLWELPMGRLCNSPLNFPSNHQVDNILYDKPTSFNSGIEHGLPEIVTLQQSIEANNPSLQHSLPDYDKESVKQEMGRGDSLSDCSDQMEDDEDQKVANRSGRRNQSKNLVAERKRRKKLNDRLYALRALVPKITKMDRASILGDAIEFVKELQKQVKDLQDELEEAPDEEAAKQNGNGQLDTQNADAVAQGDNKSPEEGSGLVIIDQGTRCSSSNKTSDASKQNPDSLSTDDKGQQMEVQVEVSQVNGNEFFVKIFCEHKAGGFVRLMEAMNSLGLEVTNANITTFRGLVLNVVKVEKKDSETVQADQVRESLLELTRNPTGGWSEPEMTTEGIPEGFREQLHHRHHHEQQQHSPNHLHHRHHCR